MGSEHGAEDERPVHEVRVAPFLIGKYAVTIREYHEFLDSNPDQHRPICYDDPKQNDPLQPVTSVNWFDAVAYCEWISKATGQRYRLPAEAEWEFAATSGDPSNLYPWGKRCWEQLPELHARFQNGPERAGSFEPNAFGIHDMGINVHEWCSDWYDASYYAVSPHDNPGGPGHGTRRASRGGSWRHQIKITRCAARSSIPPSYRYADYGFRICTNHRDTEAQS